MKNALIEAAHELDRLMKSDKDFNGTIEVRFRHDENMNMIRRVEVISGNYVVVSFED